jgi:hypothetical protein
MKPQIVTQKGVIAGIIGLMITLSLCAQNNVFVKEIKKEFPVNQKTTLEISNKYGNVDIINCDEATLSIQVNISVKARDKEKADVILNMVNINISQADNVIKAVTVLSNDFGKVFRGSNICNDGLEINYSVTMPKTLPLNLLNKYGNVFVNELVSTSTIEVKYGNLKANKIIHDSKEPLTKIILSYSKGSIQETKWLEMDIRYSEINLSNNKALAIVSKYSKVFVTIGSSVVSESKYDSYKIDKLNNFVATAAYSHFSIGNLAEKLQVDSKYTDVIVDHLPAGFENIKITNSYGNYKLGIDPGASYRINGYAKYCNINYPVNNAKVSRFDENNEIKINGVVGNEDNPKSEVSVTSHYGNIRLVP